jgi:hypothetical protein
MADIDVIMSDEPITEEEEPITEEEESITEEEEPITEEEEPITEEEEPITEELEEIPIEDMTYKDYFNLSRRKFRKETIEFDENADFEKLMKGLVRRLKRLKEFEILLIVLKDPEKTGKKFHVYSSTKNIKGTFNFYVQNAINPHIIFTSSNRENLIDCDYKNYLKYFANNENFDRHVKDFVKLHIIKHIKERDTSRKFYSVFEDDTGKSDEEIRNYLNNIYDTEEDNKYKTLLEPFLKDRNIFDLKSLKTRDEHRRLLKRLDDITKNFLEKILISKIKKEHKQIFTSYDRKLKEFITDLMFSYVYDNFDEMEKLNPNNFKRVLSSSEKEIRTKIRNSTGTFNRKLGNIMYLCYELAVKTASVVSLITIEEQRYVRKKTKRRVMVEFSSERDPKQALVDFCKNHILYGKESY